MNFADQPVDVEVTVTVQTGTERVIFERTLTLDPDESKGYDRVFDCMTEECRYLIDLTVEGTSTSNQLELTTPDVRIVQIYISGEQDIQVSKQAT